MNVQLLSDQQLLNSYLSGDQSAISQLIEKHRRRVTDYIRMLVKDRDVADDIFQDTFIKVIRTIDSRRYVENGRFLSWVLRIAHNQVIDHFRQLKQSGKVNESDAGFDILNTLRFSERTVEDDIVDGQISEQIRAMVAELPDEQREVVMMRYYSGLSFKEIAETTGVGINTALGRMRYALLNLRKMMREKNINLS